ncbi:MAG TPA: phosphatase PAP2 family protein [Mycobacteriales bacterium]|nr:phosphatase PAP2 family protein [Mycobacteriales bacterium]
MTERLRDRVHAADEELFLRVARRHDPRLDAVVPRVTNAADYGLLWLVSAAALAATGRKGRCAAARALVSMNVVSGIANGPAKWVARRPRPTLTEVPVLRQLPRQPRTSSFPSGHSATAAAFATAVALESPLRGVPMLTLAAGVAYGRVHVGVHYPSDVVAGVALGIVGAVVVRRFAFRSSPVHRQFTDAP